MPDKFISLNEPLYRYLLGHRSDSLDGLLRDLRDETASLGDDSRMQISPEQGTFLQILAAATGAKLAIEVGVFTGYSSICIGRGLPPGGKLICIDESKEWTDIARKYWARAKLSDVIELRLGPATSILQGLPEQNFDFAFIDADKEEYDSYYELLLPRMKRNGLLLFDNMLWGGRLGNHVPEEAAGRAIHNLNKKLAADSRVECVLLPIADGIQFCRKL